MSKKLVTSTKYARPRSDAWYSKLTDAQIDNLFNESRRFGWEYIRDNILPKLNVNVSRSAYYRFLLWYSNSLRLHKAPTVALQYLADISHTLSRMEEKIDTLSLAISKKTKSRKR